LATGVAAFLATSAARFFATGVARFTFLAPIFRAGAVFLRAVIFRAGAVFFRADAFFLPAAFRTDAVFFPADRVRPALRRVVAAFPRAVFRLAAFRLAMSSSSFLRPTGPPDGGP
jgi:hypothetical protein